MRSASPNTGSGRLLGALGVALALALGLASRDASAAEPAKPGEVEAARAAGQGGETGELRRLDEETERLVGRAPLTNPNVSVHVVQPKQFSDALRHELVLYPAAVQMNGRFTEHVGTALSYLFHINESFAVQVTPQYNWLAQPSAFSRELIDKAGVDAVAASSLLLQWAVQGGVEVTPFYGKLALHNRVLGRFAFIINAGAGIGGTRHELKPGNAAGPATYGDTGNRFIGSVGAGFRIQIADRYTIRLEVRDIVLTARVDRINGCNAADLNALIDARAAGDPLAGAAVTGACRVGTFEGVDGGGRPRSDDLLTAHDLVLRPSSDVLNTVSFFAGFSVVF